MATHAVTKAFDTEAIRSRGYRSVPEQQSYALLVADALASPVADRAIVSMLEAETGIGKTLGYLIPLCLHCSASGDRAVVSTRTNHLSRQVLLEDGPLAIHAVQEMTGHKLRIARRVGRCNYVDIDRVLRILADDDTSVEDALLLSAWVKEKPETFEMAADIGLVLPERMNPADICLLATSPGASQGAYLRDVAESKDADILVTNHTLSLLHALTGMRILDGDRKAKVIVFDEADTLPDAARALHEYKIAMSTLVALVMAAPDCKEKQATIRSLSALMEIMGRYLQTKYVVLINESMTDIIGAVTNVLGNLRDLAAAVQTNNGKLTREKTTWLQEMDGARGHLAKWMDSISDIHNLSSNITASPTRRFPSLGVTAMDPARVLRSMWRKRQGDSDDPSYDVVMFTSATLAAPSGRMVNSLPSLDFSKLKIEVGVGPEDNFRDDLSGRFAPSQFGKLRITLADRKTPVPFLKTFNEDEEKEYDPEWLSYVASGITKAHGTGERALVLTPSFRDVCAIGELVPFARQHKRGEKLNPLLEEFTENPSAVLLTPSAWAGVNLPGIVKNLIIPRMPVPPLDEARIASFVRLMARYHKSEAEARGIMIRRDRETAQRRLRQGVGRGIRSPSDECHLWILDPRFPLPEKWVDSMRYNQGAAAGWRYMRSCIPARFLEGAFSAYDKAQIHPF